MSQLTAQSYKGRLLEVTVTHLKLPEVFICSEHRADVIPIR